MMDYFILIPIALSLMFFAHKKFKGIVGINKEKVMKFVRFMALVSAIRLVLFSGMSSNQAIDSIGLLSLAMVFWEDAVFTLPALVLDRAGASKKVVNSILAISAIVFASGHVSYGFTWMLLTLLYVPFISFKYGKKYGLGTVMVCHILYDVMTLITYNLVRG
jgi:membrane protease YdiL (CAAX protease family)